MTIHKEGRELIGWLFIILFGINIAVSRFPIGHWFTLVAVLSILIFFAVLQFFRVPKRKIPVNDKSILAPADGKVVVIEEAEESEYFNDRRIQVSIFMSPLNVHSNVNPISGIVKFFKYHKGKYLVAWHPKSSTENERTTMVLQHKTGTEILLRQIAGALARRICWYVKEGQQVEQGKEFGFIKFGSRVDMFLPIGTKINVTLGQKTTGGVTQIAELSE
jgi:phosphatidylserine decarboxylase